MAKGRTQAYYDKNPDARAKKAAYQKRYNAKPSSVKKRSELVKERRKRGIYGEGGGDLSHQADGSIRREDKSKNRGNGTRTPGDRRARGKKK
jgi:hypothetical protein